MNQEKDTNCYIWFSYYSSTNENRINNSLIEKIIMKYMHSLKRKCQPPDKIDKGRDEGANAFLLTKKKQKKQGKIHLC